MNVRALIDAIRSVGNYVRTTPIDMQTSVLRILAEPQMEVSIDKMLKLSSHECVFNGVYTRTQHNHVSMADFASNINFNIN